MHKETHQPRSENTTQPTSYLQPTRVTEETYSSQVERVILQCWYSRSVEKGHCCQPREV